MASLSLYSNSKLVWKRRLGQQEYLIGRGESCHLVVPSRLASRRHAKLSPAEDGFLLEDLESENGTYVDGRIEYRIELREPATVQIGDDIILFDPADEGDEHEPGQRPQSGSSLDQIPDTYGVGPVVLRRMQADRRRRTHPHLILGRGEQQRVFVLKSKVSAIGYGAVEIPLGPSPKRKTMVLAEIVQEEDGSFSVRSKGLFAKVTVNRAQKTRHALKRGDRISIDSHSLVFHPGLEK